MIQDFNRTPSQRGEYLESRRYLIGSIGIICGMYVGIHGLFDMFADPFWACGSRVLTLGIILLGTAIIVSPILIAFFLLEDGNLRWRKNLRRCYAITMSLFFILYTGGIAIPYIIVGVILLWPDIRGYFHQGGLIPRLSIFGLTLGSITIFIWWYWFYFPLLKDERFIEHFRVHRTEFEELAQGYRNHRDGKINYESSSQEVQTLMRKAEVEDISLVEDGSFGRWFPEPYSEHTLQIRKSLEFMYMNKISPEEEIMRTYKEKLPLLFKGVGPLEDESDVANVTLALKFRLDTNFAQGEWKNSHRYNGRIPIKGFCYFPQPPKVENGHIVNAGYSSADKAYTRPGLRVFDSLSSFPPNLEQLECVVKRINDHWFIYMCR